MNKSKSKKVQDVYIVKEYIYYYIKETKSSKRKFCKLCNIKLKTIRMINRKDYNFEISELINISNFLNIPLYKLMIGLNKTAREQQYFLLKEA